MPSISGLSSPSDVPRTPVRVTAVFAILFIALFGIDRLNLFVNSPQTGIYGGFSSQGYTIQKLFNAKSSAPLAAGMQITTIDGIPVSNWFQSLFHLAPGKGPSWSSNRAVSLTVVEQNGPPRTLLLTLRPFSAEDLLGPFWIWFLGWFVLFSGAYLLFRYPVQYRVNLLSFLLLVSAMSIFNHSGRHLAIEMSPRLPLLIAFRFATLSFIFSAWMHLIVIFLKLRGHFTPPYWIPGAIYLLPPAAALCAAWFPGGDLLSGYERLLRMLYFSSGSVVAFTFAILLHSYYGTRDAILKAQLKWLLWGHLLGMSPYVLLYALPIALVGVPLIQYSAGLAPLPLIVFSYFFAFYRYRLMDVDRVIENSLVYGISAGLLSLGYLTALWLVKEEILAGTVLGTWFRSDLLILIGLAFVFNPLKNQVQRGIERTLFPERIGLSDLLLEESAQISRAATLNEISGVLLTGLPDKLFVERAALVLRRPYGDAWEIRQNPKGWLKLDEPSLSALETLGKTPPLKPFWDLMSPEETADDRLSFLKTGATAVFPLKSVDDLWGFYFLGEKRTHRLLTNEEVHVIITLVTQTAHLVGNARLLEGLQQTNRSLGELTGRLMQAEQMANLGEGAAVLAHELKNPLGIIRGSAEILLKDPDHAQKNEILHFILDETDRLAAQVDEFMQFARMAPPQKTATDLNDLVQSVAFLWESRRKSTIPLTIRFQLDLPSEKIPLDSRQVYQVLLNLFSNAEAALPKGGELLLSTGQDDPSGMVWASVRDTGKGIPEKNLSRVFDRFFTTKESGLGLGLALAKKVMEAHGGSIRIESTEGEGTRVTLFFPRQEGSGIPPGLPRSGPEKTYHGE